MYSQNNEDDLIAKYFEHHANGRLLSIGENDGRTFSNALLLIEKGWYAVLVEPAPDAYGKLMMLHLDNPRVQPIQAAIAETEGRAVLHRNGAHLPAGTDTDLLSTLIPEERERWGPYVWFREDEVSTITFAALQRLVGGRHYNFISIDAEGMDLAIMRQLGDELAHVDVFCIEWNSIDAVKREILGYCRGWGLTEVLCETPENIVLTRGRR